MQALERLRLCCSILPVRGFWDNGHNTHYTHKKHITKTFYFVVPWAAGKKSPPKNTASSFQNHKIQTAALQIKRRYELHPGTQTSSQLTPHALYLFPSSDTPRSLALRWNVCGSAVRSYPCGAFGMHTTHNTYNTHNKRSSLRWALGCGKQVPSQKYRLVLTKP